MTFVVVDDEPQKDELSFPIVGPAEDYSRPERTDRILFMGAAAVIVIVAIVAFLLIR